MKKKFVVVKFHDKEKYAVAVRGGSYHECETYASYCRGLHHDMPEVKFGIYDAAHYDMCVQVERQGGGELYDLLATTTYTERIEMRVSA